ncbi:Fic family protein [Pseudomonas capeferrum]|uniref:Fic family protein n=1 Tax=Pseudomonas capeferrum TaxID=1495066 RepID=UPI00280BF9A4|nr:Fic family protein [Pseudomonas capeferrum]
MTGSCRPATGITEIRRVGLRVFLERAEGQSRVMRSAIAAFGFVYIHPLADGNGRVRNHLSGWRGVKFRLSRR